MPRDADLLVTHIAQLATPTAVPQRGPRQGELRVIEDAAMAVTGGRITWVGPRADWTGKAHDTLDANGRVLIPGLVDPHTHAVWGGERLGDFEARARGEGYEAILARGGGIRSSIRATAQASEAELVNLARPRLHALQRSGATTIEVKSGYGLDPAAELRMLHAIRALRHELPAELVPTLLVHVPPVDDRDGYVDALCREWIPQVARERLAEAVDVFVEREAFTVSEAGRLLRAARAHGLRVKLHADQFHALGGTELGVELGALSVDHLEASTAAQLQALGASDTVATLLPGVTLHLGLPAANGRALLDGGAAVALGTDLNPGSSPLFSMQLAVALGVRLNGLTPGEALVAGTANAAHALGRDDRGVLAPGMRADYLLLDSHDWRDVTYALGGPVVQEVWIAGRRVV